MKVFVDNFEIYSPNLSKKILVHQMKQQKIFEKKKHKINLPRVTFMKWFIDVFKS